MKFIAIFFLSFRQKILKAILVEKYDKTNEIHFKWTLETSECFYHVRIFKLILSTLLFIMICNNIYLFCSLSSVDATKFPAAKCFLFHKRARNYKMSIDFYENKDLLWSFNSLGTSLSHPRPHPHSHIFIERAPAAIQYLKSNIKTKTRNKSFWRWLNKKCALIHFPQ